MHGMVVEKEKQRPAPRGFVLRVSDLSRISCFPHRLDIFARHSGFRLRGGLHAG